MNLNKAFIIGNLTRDPEMRSLPSGQAVANFGLATNRMWKSKDGSPQKQTEFHNIVMFGRLAEIAQQYLKKGGMIMVEGRIQNRSWEGQDGQKRSRTEIIAENMQMGAKSKGTGTGGNYEKSDSSAPRGNSDAGQEKVPENTEEEIRIEDIPF